MPVKSYLIFPKEGQGIHAIKALAEFSHCQVIPEDNEEVIVLVTDSDTEKQDEDFLEILKENTHIQHISLIAGFST